MAVLLLSLALRLSYLFFLGDFIGADEAVGGLMALHIAQGREFPLLLWEAHYGGTLISYLGALLFLFVEPLRRSVGISRFSVSEACA